MRPALSALFAASILLLPSAAEAAGFIVIDPAFNNMGVRPMPISPVLPILPHPGPNPRPNPRPIPRPSPRPVLKGGVSIGLHLKAQDIKVEITDQVAKTYVTQTFYNDTDRDAAGTYLFPLPDDTTFSSFSLHIDGKPVEGKILEAKEARAQYEAIVRQMVDPGLLEYADQRSVRARIFPIPAHGTKKVELEYTQLLKAENGMVKYRFPLKRDNDAAGGAVDDTVLTVKMTGKVGLKTIWSPSHKIKVERPEERRAKLNYSEKNSLCDKDFLLYYSLSDKDMAANLLTHKIEGEDGYFLLSLTPPIKVPENQIVAKDIVLLADTSGSMQGEKIEQTKKALKHVITSLNAQDRFGIVPFNTDADSMASSLLPANLENKRKAVDFIDELEAKGGTNIGDALNSGKSLLKAAGDRPAYLVLLTDGEPTVGETSLKGLAASLENRNLRVFDFGVGYDVNTRLLNRLSSDNHGTAQFVEPGESLEVALSSFYDKIRAPMMSDVEIKFNGVTVKDTYPRSVKDLFAGNQVLLLGRYKGSGAAKLEITGKVNGALKSFSFPLEFSGADASSSHLTRLWAMRRIGYLTEVAQANGENKEVIDEIIELSKRHGIITNYTSFLVTDPSENNRIVRPRFDQVLSFGSMNRPGAAPRPSSLAAEKSIAAGSAAGFSQRAAINNESPLLRDFRVVSGKDAFERNKKASQLKESIDFESEGKTEHDKMKGATAKTAAIRRVADKTFYLAADGFYVDSLYKAVAGNRTPETVVFGSARYFELTRLKNAAAYLSVGKKLLLVIDGKPYKIVFESN